MAIIESFRALEILDSRGRPTVSATCRLATGVEATVSVPSGASTGAAEAMELRDGDPSRYRGLGCRTAVRNIRETINKAASRQEFESQSALDEFLLELDGTADKSRLGANAILACSLAFSRATASEQGTPLYEQLGLMLGVVPDPMPRLSINLFSGGKHAGEQVAIQDVLVVPESNRSVDEALAMTFEVYQTAAEICASRYQARLLTADEGGLSPPFATCEQMFETAIESIERAGYVAGRDVALAVDVAASHFESDGQYRLDGKRLDGDAMVDRLIKWIDDYPIISIEDGLAQEDWRHWSSLLKRCDKKNTLVVGDDLLCTNPTRIQRAIECSAADTLLLKVNQIGTLTEAAKSYQLARNAGWKVVVSARSGETEDDWLADLAYGWRADFIKVGSITQSERLAKYNRLLAIEQDRRM